MLLPGTATPSCIRLPLSFHFIVFTPTDALLLQPFRKRGHDLRHKIWWVGVFSFTTTTGVGLAEAKTYFVMSL